MATKAMFLERLQRRLGNDAHPNLAHPLPPLGPTPRIGHRDLDESDLVGSFTRAAQGVSAVVHQAAGFDLAAFAQRHAITSVVCGKGVDPRTFEAVGLTVLAYQGDATARADLGVTWASAGLAATGAIVHDSDLVGGRTVSLLPRAHLVYLRKVDIVRTTTEVLRPLASREAMPANLVLIAGPSRSGDIENIITLGVHGPPVVEIVLV
jgi:L-lactate utilization protein LutC